MILGSFWSRRQGIAWAALIMSMSVLASRFMGLLRDKIISYLFGATAESDLYFAAFVIPDFINYLLAGAYFSITLIPLLTLYFSQNEEEGWGFFSAVFTWVAISITILTGLAIGFASKLAHLAAPGLDEQALSRLALFLRIVLPAQICFLLGSCITAILYMRKQFIVPALTPLIYNLSIILGGILLRERGMEGFCWGVLVGAFFGNLLLPALAARKGGGARIRFSFYHPGIKKFIILALPLMLGQSIVMLDEQFLRIFGSLAGIGAISWLNYARRIMLVPVGVVAQAAGVASYPFMAELVAKKELSQFYQVLNTALQSVLILLVPLSAWMIVASEPIIRLIFQQGHFGPSDTQETARLLQILLVVVFCWGFQQILGRAFYAWQDTVTPAVLGTLVTLGSIPLFYFLAKDFHATGVALASAVSVAIYTAALAMRWRARFGRETFKGIGETLFRITAISLIACIPSVFALKLFSFQWKNHPYSEALCLILASGLFYALTFLVLANHFVPSLVRPHLKKLGHLGRWLTR